MKAKKLAKYIVASQNFHGDLISNKKLQKLLYYVDAWSLVHFDSELINENFEAWVHGPVVRTVYQSYKDFGYSPISIDYKKGKKPIDVLNHIEEKNSDLKQRKDLINMVLQKYGALSSFQLELLSHSETPWLNARKGLNPTEAGNKIIDKKEMKEYYLGLLNGKK